MCLRQDWEIDLVSEAQGGGRILSRADPRASSPDIRLGLNDELHGSDRRVAIQDGPGNSVHAVHHTPVRTQDDRIREIDFLNQPNVVDDPPDRWRRSEREPEVRVDVSDGIKRDLSDR